MRYVAFLPIIVGCGRIRFSDEPRVDDSGLFGSDSGSAAPDASTLLDGCVLLERMDEPAWNGTAGEVIDSCSTNPGTTVGGITTVANGTRGRAGLFNGTGCIQIKDAANLRLTTGLTISAWIYPTGDPVNSFGIVSKRIDFDNSTAYSLFLWTNNQIYGDIDTENDRDFGTAMFPASTWKQTTIVFDGSLPEAQRTTFYADGAFDKAIPETSTSITQFTDDLAVGCLPLSGVAQQFIGELDDVAIWNRPLTATEVAAWYASTTP